MDTEQKVSSVAGSVMGLALATGQPELAIVGGLVSLGSAIASLFHKPKPPPPPPIENEAQEPMGL